MSAAKKIIEKMVSKYGAETEAKALREASTMRWKNASPAAEAFNQENWAVLKARKNEKLAEEANKLNGDIKAKVIADEQVPRFKAPEPSAEKMAEVEKVRKVDSALISQEAREEAERAERLNKFKMVDDKTVAVDDTTKLAGAGFGGAAMGSGFTNPADIVKAGYNKFEQARQSVVDKIVDLTDMTAHNPHVPQYAKDTYNKAADALVSNATDPLNAVGGVGTADAALGVGSAAYDMYSNNRPSSSYVDNKPVTNPTQVVNWKK